MGQAASTLPTDLVERLRAVLGPDGIVTDLASLEPFLCEERGHYRGTAQLVLLPNSTKEVSEAVRICAQDGVPLVPQGGNTGLVGGAVSGPGEVVLSLRRMNRILAVDPLNGTMTVEAGAILENVQAAAGAEGFLFPLRLGAEGSCQIGGNISTNAGGINVLRFGTMRDLVLGLEVVLADGRIWDGLRGLHKDNTGYGLRHLFIGAEGTLGIVTRAVLKLYPKPLAQHTAFCALASAEKATRLFSMLKQRFGEMLTACEMMSSFSVEVSARYLGARAPFADDHVWYVLFELSCLQNSDGIAEAMEAVLSEALENGIIADAVIAASLEQAAMFWRLRECIPEGLKHEGASVKHDIAVPISRLQQFVEAADTAVLAIAPGTRTCVFGHLGDGNLHYNLAQPMDASGASFLAQANDIAAAVYTIVSGLEGSISAEHGIGLLKTDALLRHKTRVEMDLMSALKQALDPQAILNPGKVLKRL